MYVEEESELANAGVCLVGVSPATHSHLSSVFFYSIAWLYFNVAFFFYKGTQHTTCNKTLTSCIILLPKVPRFVSLCLSVGLHTPYPTPSQPHISATTAVLYSKNHAVVKSTLSYSLSPFSFVLFCNENSTTACSGDWYNAGDFVLPRQL